MSVHVKVHVLVERLQGTLFNPLYAMDVTCSLGRDVGLMEREEGERERREGLEKHEGGSRFGTSDAVRTIESEQ